MRPILPCSTLFLLLAFSASARTAAAQEDGEFRSDWLAKDVAMAASVRAALEAPPEKLATLGAALRVSRGDFDRDAGFGGRRTRFSRSGGYTSCWIDVHSWKGEVVDFALFQGCSREREPRVWAALAEVWGDDAVAGEDGFSVQLRRAEVLARYRAAIEAKLGPAPPEAPGSADTPRPYPVSPADPLDLVEAARRRALETLCSPREIYDLGTVCYYAGIAPAGREALERLVEARDLLSLRRALRGFNPEGRIYAAEGLLRLQQEGALLALADVEAIEHLRALPIRLGTCMGCFVFDRTAEEVLSEREL